MRRPEAVLFVALLLVYNLNLRQVSSHDTYASRFVPISILRDGDLILDEFVPETIRQQAGDDFFSDYFHYVRGHFYDSHPPVGPLLALPVYALPAWIGIPARAELVANLFSKLAASIIAALSAVAVFAASRRFVKATKPPSDQIPADRDDEMRIALMTACAYALATSMWSTASLAMWTHTPAVLGYAVALWALTAGRWSLAGVAAAAAAFARPATAPAVALLAIYLAHSTFHKRHATRALVRFCAGAAAAGLGGALYNYWLFGNAVGGARLRTAIWLKEFGTTDMFSGSLPVGLAGLTVSPSRGLLIFSPVVVVAAVGAWRAWRASPSNEMVLLARYASVAAVVILLTYSKFIAWWGGHGFGPRYLTDAMPFLGLLFTPGFALLWDGSVGLGKRIARAAVAVVLAYSIVIQAVGAFCWPSQWTLNDHPPYRVRLWDWSNSEIEVCIREGPKIDPAARTLLKRLGF